MIVCGRGRNENGGENLRNGGQMRQRDDKQIDEWMNEWMGSQMDGWIGRGIGR